MKFNWGHGIFIAMLLGASGFASLVYITSKEKIDMVKEEYYPKGLKYQNMIQASTNYQALPEQIVIRKSDRLLVTFPAIAALPEDITGTIQIYRPSDKDLDVREDVKLDSLYTQYFELNLFKTGKYEVIVEWQANDVNYFTKAPLYID